MLKPAALAFVSIATSDVAVDLTSSQRIDVDARLADTPIRPCPGMPVQALDLPRDGTAPATLNRYRRASIRA